MGLNLGLAISWGKFGTLQDITERKQAEEEICRNAARAQLLADIPRPVMKPAGKDPETPIDCLRVTLSYVHNINLSALNALRLGGIGLSLSHWQIQNARRLGRLRASFDVADFTWASASF
jgi:hypothetical protein